MSRSLFSLAVALVVLAPIAAAQNGPAELALGSRIRIQQLHGATVQGALVAITDTAVTLRTSETDTVSIARTGIAKVEIYEGMHSNAGKGALKGLLIGGLTGVVLGAASGSATQGSYIEYSAGEGAVVFGATLGLLGTGIGALVGSGSHHETWQPTVLPTVKVVRDDSKGRRLALGVRISF